MSISFKEAKTLMKPWAKDAVQGTVAASIRYHSGEHSLGVGARNVWQYLRKAEAFRQNLSGSTKKALKDGKVRYTKGERFIILDYHGKIVSFGRAKKRT